MLNRYNFLFLMSNNPLPPHIDNRILQGLLTNDHATIDGIYKRLAEKIKQYVIHNNGSEEEAGDLFQETIIDIFKQAQNNKLVLTCPFDSFFLMVAKRKWLNILKKTYKKQVTNSEDVLLLHADESYAAAEVVHLEAAKEKLYREQLVQLSERCQEIIKATLQAKHQEQVAEELGVSYNYLRKKKSECLDQLVTNIRSVSHTLYNDNDY
mgnify:CR=1 FL=1